jgi:transposase
MSPLTYQTILGHIPIKGISAATRDVIRFSGRRSMMVRFDLTDFEWSVIQPLLPMKVRGVPRVDDRRLLNGIFRRLRTGAPWADIPPRYGRYTTCVNRFNRCQKAGVWARILAAVSKTYDRDIQMIDSSTVRVHQHAANGQKKTDPVAWIARTAG